MVSSLCILTCVWAGLRRIGRKIQAKHFFWKWLVLSNRKIQQRWVSLPRFSCKLWDPFEPWQTSLLAEMGTWRLLLLYSQEAHHLDCPSDGLNTCWWRFSKSGYFISNLQKYQRASQKRSYFFLHSSTTGNPVLIILTVLQPRTIVHLRTAFTYYRSWQYLTVILHISERFVSPIIVSGTWK